MSRELLHLSAAQIEGLSREKTVFFLALGPLEDHGPHLPLGLDLLEAQSLCASLSQQMEAEMPGWHAIHFPALPLGATTHTRRLALRAPAVALKDALLGQLLPLQNLGFKHFAIVTGHLGARQMACLEEVGRALRFYQNGFRSLVSWLPGKKAPPSTFYLLSASLVSQKDVFHSPLWLDAPEHGGERDTSIALAIAPQWVQAQGDKGYPHLTSRTRHPQAWARAWENFRNRTSDYWGTPARASVEKGKTLLSEQTQAIFPRFRATLEGKIDPLLSFRTWYAAFPPNRTYFRGWILVFISLFFLWMMASLSMQMLGVFQIATQ